MKKKDFIGDGKSFFDAVAVSGMKNDEIWISMGISNGTFYRLYRKEKFTENEKTAAAKALGKTVEDIFGRQEQPATPQQSEGDRIRQQKAFGEKKERGLIFVPISAKGGYGRSIQDPVFVDQLKRMHIPGLPYQSDDYRIFEVSGDSMEYYDKENRPAGLPAGTLVIAELVPQSDWENISEYYIHVIVTEDDILIKRLQNNAGKDGYILLSDSEGYEPVEIKKTEVREIWLVKRNIGWNMPPPRRFGDNEDDRPAQDRKIEEEKPKGGTVSDIDSNTPTTYDMEKERILLNAIDQITRVNDYLLTKTIELEQKERRPAQQQKKQA